MKTEAGLAISYLRKTGGQDLYVGVPAGSVNRVHLPSNEAKARFVTAVLKAKCETGEELELFGEPVAPLSPQTRARLRRRIAAVSPIVGLLTNLNVWENVSLPAAYHGMPPLEHVAALAGEVPARFGIEAQPFLARLPEELDALEVKVAAFIRLLVAGPELALVDAVGEGLSRDERARASLFEAEFRARLPGATLLFVDAKEEG
jgi:ABC-type transporter Mla maintaining outer membrane lipid asymmetry ATPase subunit MlaF